MKTIHHSKRKIKHLGFNVKSCAEIMYHSKVHKNTKHNRALISDIEIGFIIEIEIFAIVGAGRDIYTRQFSLPMVGIAIIISLSDWQSRKKGTWLKMDRVMQ